MDYTSKSYWGFAFLRNIKFRCPTDNAKIEVSHAQDKAILHTNLSQEQQTPQLDLSGYGSGFYLVRFISKNEIKTRKINVIK